LFGARSNRLDEVMGEVLDLPQAQNKPEARSLVKQTQEKMHAQFERVESNCKLLEECDRGVEAVAGG
jgi:hypothetical protein